MVNSHFINTGKGNHVLNNAHRAYEKPNVKEILLRKSGNANVAKIT